MSYRIAGIDVHKKMLAVVVADVEIESEYQFERRLFGSNPEHLRLLAGYWRPICQKREGADPKSGTLHLAQAQSNRGPRGRKKDFPDAERLVKRLVANELTLSFVPDAEQRLWRTVMRRKYQLTRNRVQLENRLEVLLEEAQIKLSSLVSDLLGVSARRMLKALGDGETKPAVLAAMADKKLRATPTQLVRRARRLHGAQCSLPPAVEDDARGVAIARAAGRPTGPGDGQFAQPAPGLCEATGGDARLRRRLSTADHRRSGCDGRDVSFRQTALLVGGCMSWR